MSTFRGSVQFGKPSAIHVDNAPEFHSDALERGCDQHGIRQIFRPKKQPHYGGIIERVIGTAMEMSHELPGTTFSNIQERGTYRSKENAALTLQELERWLVLAIANYHKNVHSALQMPPEAFWKSRAQHSDISSIRDERAFLVDFLPVVKRSVSRRGFVIDHIAYYADILKPWIARRDRLGKFIIRRDPRDLSRIWVLDPVSVEYVEVPYRFMSNPSVTLWEHRRAIEQLRQHGRSQLDESSIFRMIEKMRVVVHTAEKETMRARRDRVRRKHLTETSAKIELALPRNHRKKNKIKPFDDIEEW